MPTKLSLALGPEPASRQVAWGCLTTNLAMPGFGSLLGGRKVGYAQVPFYLIAFALTTIFGFRFFVWYFANSSRLDEMQLEPDVRLQEIWLHVRWSLLGVVMFLFVMAWALITSLDIIARAKAREAKRLPPLIHPGAS